MIGQSQKMLIKRKGSIVILYKTFNVASSAEYFIRFTPENNNLNTVLVCEQSQSQFDLSHHGK